MEKDENVYSIVGYPSGEVLYVNGLNLIYLYDEELIQLNKIKNIWIYDDKDVDKIKIYLK